jgi:hypothetical protein
MKSNWIIELFNEVKIKFFESSVSFKISMAIVIYQMICFYNEHLYESVIENLIRAFILIPFFYLLYRFIFLILLGYIDDIALEKENLSLENNNIDYRKIEQELSNKRNEVSERIAYRIFYILNIYNIFF